MTKRWVAFVDDDDHGGDHEFWSVFCTPFFVGDTEEEATQKAQDYIKMRQEEELKEDGDVYYTLRLVIYASKEQ